MNIYIVVGYNFTGGCVMSAHTLKDDADEAVLHYEIEDADNIHFDSYGVQEVLLK